MIDLSLPHGKRATTEDSFLAKVWRFHFFGKYMSLLGISTILEIEHVKVFQFPLTCFFHGTLWVSENSHHCHLAKQYSKVEGDDLYSRKGIVPPTEVLDFIKVSRHLCTDTEDIFWGDARKSGPRSQRQRAVNLPLFGMQAKSASASIVLLKVL